MERDGDGEVTETMSKVKPNNLQVAAVAENIPFPSAAMPLSPELFQASGEEEVTRTQSEPEEQLVAVGYIGSSKQPTTVDARLTASETSKTDKLDVQILPTSNPAAEHNIISLSTASDKSHLSSSLLSTSSPPIAPKPKKKPRVTQTLEEGEVTAVTPVATVTHPREKVRSPNAVLVMPKGLAEHIALRSPGGVRGDNNRGEIASSESPPNAKRPKLIPPGAVRVMPMDMSPLADRRGRNGGDLVTRVIMNGIASDQEEEEAVSFDEVCLDTIP